MILEDLLKDYIGITNENSNIRFHHILMRVSINNVRYRSMILQGLFMIPTGRECVYLSGLCYVNRYIANVNKYLNLFLTNKKYNHFI